MTTIRHLLTQTCLVESVTQSQSTTGGQIKTKANKHVDLPCLIERISGGEQPILGREGVVITHTMYVEVFDIVEADIVTQGGRVFDVELSDDVQDRGDHAEIRMVERK